MSRDWQLWGTFSVGDHLRRNSFVAELLLYDRLIIPVPPEGTDERQRWVEMGWRPELQDDLLATIRRVSPNSVTCVPWAESMQDAWQERYETARLTNADIERVHAGTADFDLKGLEPGPSFSVDEFQRRGGRPEEVDDLAHFTSRELLVDWSSGLRNDTDLFMSVPDIDVTAVPAFGSYRDFHAESPVVTAGGGAEPGNLLLVGARLLVPTDPDLPHVELLERASELAQLPETEAHREAFHRWRREVQLAGRDVRDAQAELEEAIAGCRNVMRRKKWRWASRFSMAVIALGAGVATALGAPAAIGAAGSFVGLGQWAEAEFGGRQRAQPQFAALFHDAQRRFGWQSA